MKKTNEQVLKFINTTLKKYDSSEEKFHTRILNYMVNNILTKNQMNFLSEVKQSLSGQSSLKNIYLDNGFPYKLKHK